MCIFFINLDAFKNSSTLKQLYILSRYFPHKWKVFTLVTGQVYIYVIKTELRKHLHERLYLNVHSNTVYIIQKVEKHLKDHQVMDGQAKCNLSTQQQKQKK